MLNDEYYMRLALQLAEKALGQTGINPVVGCVIVKEGRIVGLGSHLQRGSHHAEVNALLMAGKEAEGGTAYVTLEPCSFYGRTPPCADRLVAEKISRVVVACTDPNPKVAGTGIEKLRSHGVRVDVGVLEQEARQLNEMFNKFIVTRLPFVTLKSATTLDGKIASRSGDSKWISGDASRAQVHMLRHRHQAIMVGVETVIADDPLLTARLEVAAIQPVRLVVDSKLRIPLDAKVVKDQSAKTIVLTTNQASIEQIMRLNALGVEVIKCGDGPRVDLRKAMATMTEREIGSILLEGGGRLNGAMLEAGLVDKIVLYLAPKIVGGADAPGAFALAGFERMADAIALERVTIERIGDDCCITGYPRSERRQEACSPES
ncbi:bifunctional diaminohydroxyphosphoribosylaminopyrimidine deaminase/5-amino-6-(5-phosphoribosylamino)uracil reductase RibD [Paenibacillus mesophilus]|uniref:bifunctional diaminohydroxyphosphoribosylaminopyrimidine deaminase/5-amino-6-(5-phosphoribosylamino)uracil reductase RibD n=1 Tax=Paenibacillus mesophilus TaxID=2582849 RepID=UPI00110E4E48|nr:bifunctional diaminohydroxyphosphoribosylaminopyrimidine deaminase/5-amino-6-(5-phosphoribosylamino)uracil reductase RibD [Paenibacillus mesophilus]TMV51649.1 bifunctional diaminohydroxyphosphoribosylaminopyrimidine deaminase/5-amino-6-(5-phosphoribosylamino)uracil reductase RibD [Paenibacillus mesophilus]